MAKKDKVLNPQSELEFDDLVKKISKKYKIKDIDAISRTLAIRLQHLPVDDPYIGLDYIHNCVRRSIGYEVAKKKMDKITHEMQVDMLLNHLNASPEDTEAFDQLDKMASKGSKYAQEAISRLENRTDGQAG